MRALLMLAGITIVGVTAWTSALTFTVNGGTIIGSGLGLGLAGMAWLMDVENIDESHPDALGSLDQRERATR